jgi:hypothetical protein
VTRDALRASLEFLEQLWTDRAEFIRTWHGFEADARPWREIESAHFFLAARLLGERNDPCVQLSSIHSPLRRAVWRVLFALPRSLGAAGLRFWWTESIAKRTLRQMWGFMERTEG